MLAMAAITCAAQHRAAAACVASQHAEDNAQHTAPTHIYQEHYAQMQRTEPTSATIWIRSDTVGDAQSNLDA